MCDSADFRVSRQLIMDCSEYVGYLKIEVNVNGKNLAEMSSRNMYDFW